jgi:hypothetical protein
LTSSGARADSKIPWIDAQSVPPSSSKPKTRDRAVDVGHEHRLHSTGHGFEHELMGPSRCDTFRRLDASATRFIKRGLIGVAIASGLGNHDLLL